MYQYICVLSTSGGADAPAAAGAALAHLNAVLSSQLLGVKRAAVDGVLGELAGGHQQRRRLGEQ